jgi:hypothetical protein
VRFLAVELPAVSGSRLGRSLATLVTTLPIVMPLADRTEVVIAVVVARSDVVDVGRRLRATLPFKIAHCAAVLIANQDASPDGRPVLGESISPVRAIPARQVDHHPR